MDANPTLNSPPPPALSLPVLQTRESKWKVIGCFLLTVVAIQLVIGPKLRLSQWGASAESNAGIAEGVAWMNGRLDIPCKGDPKDPTIRLHDSAYFDGKVYNVFPPMMSILTVLVAPIHKLLLGRTDFWLQAPYVLLLYWPLPITAYFIFYRRIGDAIWAGVWTLAWIGGTTMLPNLHDVQTGYLGQIDHCLSQVGLLILAADLLGRQRIWPSLIGLLVCTYTRQMTCLYALPVIWVAWRTGGVKKLMWCAIGLVIIAAPLLTLNYLKFGKPLDFGYRYIYVGREDLSDSMGYRCATYGVFSTHFLPENIYYMHIAPPDIDWATISPSGVLIRDTNPYGTSLWLTTPLAFWIFLAAGQWWRDRKCRLLMLATLPVMFGLLCYHSPGFMEYGHNRFVLDYLPIWFVVVAPFTKGGWRTWFTLACLAWSLLYFQTIVPDITPLGEPARRAATVMVNDGKV